MGRGIGSSWASFGGDTCGDHRSKIYPSSQEEKLIASVFLVSIGFVLLGIHLIRLLQEFGLLELLGFNLSGIYCSFVVMPF